MQFPTIQAPFGFIKRFLSDNPELLKSYVEAGIIATSLIVAPLNRLLKHLIEVQGKDPNAEPGARNKELFYKELNDALMATHTKSYDDGFDFSWLRKQFKEHEGEMRELNVSEDEFRKLTDVSNLKSVNATVPSKPNMGPTTSFTAESGVPLTIDQSPLDELESLLREDAVIDPSALTSLEPVRESDRKFIKALKGIDNKLEEAFTLEGTIDSPELKKSLKKLVEIANALKEGPQEEVNPQELFAKTHLLRNKKNIIEKSEKPDRPSRVRRKSSKKTLNKAIKPIKRGSFRRSDLKE